jgi:response regulator RpfG family c-di-GMP phosphodiesterase
MLDILLAEDDEDTREAIATALEDVGHRVSRARDGNEAQSLSERHVFTSPSATSTCRSSTGSSSPVVFASGRLRPPSSS